MDWKTQCRAIVTVIVLGLGAAPAVAQITTGTLAGSVKDEQGGRLAGATVILISESRATRSTPVVTNSGGDFVVPTVTADTYTVEVTLPGFKALRRTGVTLSGGDRLALGELTLALGNRTDVVNVTSIAPVVQSGSGERSFTATTAEVANLPLATRNFASLADLAPGVDASDPIRATRIGGGGSTNYMMDGVSTMDTGSNRLLMAVNVESIAEVKVLTSGYQAEYGRSSGMQVTAVTKSGTNRFHGSLYDVMRDSDWNANSRTNILNGDPKTTSKSADWGFSIGGPVGRPGADNKLFFFYAQEFQPRSGGNDVVRFRFPTALERMGDFSQSTDNNGTPYNLIYDYTTGLPKASCSLTTQTACFSSGGVVGRIPSNRLYQTGINLLNMYPVPNLTASAGAAYNYQLQRPTESVLGWQPALRVDYQHSSSLRLQMKYTAWAQRQQTILGTLPGFNDTRMQHPIVSTVAATVNYSMNPTTFLEGTYGRSTNEQAGCSLTGTPQFCQSALAMNPAANIKNVGLDSLPFLYPDASLVNPDYYAVQALNMVQPAFWEGGRMLKPPTFQWGGRVGNAPPNIPFPGFLNNNPTQDISISLTKVAGRHAIKAGFYNTYSYKAENTSTNSFGTLNFGNDTNNPLDSSFGFSNAALGIFTSYLQAEKYVETNAVYFNTEFYVQDNWKVSPKLTFDYGVRFVHQHAQYDSLGQASNFLPDRWTIGNAPVLYYPGCTISVAVGAACPAANLQARDPRSNRFLGTNTTLAIATLVPSSGDPLNGLLISGTDGVGNTTYTAPPLGVAPRFGAAYDLSGTQALVIRGSVGLFFDRPSSTTFSQGVTNPPTSKTITVRYGQLQSLGSGGLTTEAAPALSAFEYDGKLPSSTQWNLGTQMALPWASTFDVSYVGQHSFNMPQTVNLNAVDFGTAFLLQNQNPTVAANAVPGSTAYSQDLLRPIRGYAAINQQWFRGWRTYHSLQLAFQRRFRNGISLGFNDTISLSDVQNVNPRLEHNPDGSYFIRSDQAEADRLLGDTPVDRVHIMKANFVWDLPDIRSSQPFLRIAGVIANDWQLSGIWTGRTGNAYSMGFGYQNGGTGQNLTGSPDQGARVRIVGDPGSGCSSDVYQQFNPAAFQGPLYNSVGLESGSGYMRGCFSSVLDLAVARNIRLGGGRSVQLRVDIFNAPNSAAITGRVTNVSFTSPSDPVTITNLPFDAAGSLIPSRSVPRGAGLGVANGYQTPRALQAQVRFAF